MKKSPLFSGLLYIGFGTIFTYFAITYLGLNNEWTFTIYLLVILATFDIGTGIKLVYLHFFLKNQKNKKQPKQ